MVDFSMENMEAANAPSTPSPTDEGGSHPDVCCRCWWKLWPSAANVWRLRLTCHSPAGQSYNATNPTAPPQLRSGISIGTQHKDLTSSTGLSQNGDYDSTICGEDLEHFLKKGKQKHVQTQLVPKKNVDQCP